MIPTLIHTAILLPGLSMPDGSATAEPLFDPATIITSLPEDPHDGVEWLEAEAKVIYSVDRDKVIKIKDVKVENGRLAERLFCLCNIEDIEAYGGVAMRNYNGFSDLLSECGFAFLEENNMAALYEVANGHFQGEIDNAKSIDPFPEVGAYSNIIGERRLFDQAFIGLWSISTSQGFEDIAPDIDDIIFDGEGRVTLIEEKKDNPTF